MLGRMKVRALEELLERERLAKVVQREFVNHDEQTDDLQGFPVPPCSAHGLLDDYDDVTRVYSDKPGY